MFATDETLVTTFGVGEVGSRSPLRVSTFAGPPIAMRFALLTSWLIVTSEA